MDQAEILWWAISLAVILLALAGVVIFSLRAEADELRSELKLFRKFDRDHDGKPGGSLKR